MFLFAGWLSKKSAVTNPRIRRLGFDHLDRRELLTVAPLGPVLETPVELITDGSAVPSEVGPPIDAPPTDSESYSQMTDGSGGDEGGGGGSEDPPQTSPPFLYDFVFGEQSGIYTFSGSVIDNEDPFNLTVYFGGIISGAMCSVDYDGHFSFSIELENPTGMVTAIVQDGEGLWSNQCWANV